MSMYRTINIHDIKKPISIRNNSKLLQNLYENGYAWESSDYEKQGLFLNIHPKGMGKTIGSSCNPKYTLYHEIMFDLSVLQDIKIIGICCHNCKESSFYLSVNDEKSCLILQCQNCSRFFGLVCDEAEIVSEQYLKDNIGLRVI